MDLLGVRNVPFMARRNYYCEFRQLIPWSVLAGLVEGQFASVVVSKTFNGSALLIAVASATPMAAFLFSLVWGMLCVGRPKIRLAMIFGAGAALCAGTTAAIPATPYGAIWFIAQMAAAQILLAGVVTVRSAFWKSNFPHSARGQITARLQVVRFIVSILVVLVAAVLCDRDPASYRYLFPGAALCGFWGVGMLRRIHIRGERSELRGHIRRSGDGSFQREIVEPFNITTLLSPGHVLGQMYRVLRQDRRFRNYCAAQLLIGIANLMTISIIVLVVSRDLQLGDHSEFWVTLVLIQALPRLTMLGGLHRWGVLFDRLGVVRFRVVNVCCWIMSLVFGMVATLITVASDEFGDTQFLLAVFFFTMRALVQGLAFSGGALAWNLGHLHFARAQEAEIYMGIHVSLTGMRGLIAPLAGMWLWQTFQAIGWPVWLVWALAISLSLASLAIFASMARQERRFGSPRQSDGVAD